MFIQVQVVFFFFFNGHEITPGRGFIVAHFLGSYCFVKGGHFFFYIYIHTIYFFIEG